MKCVCKSSTVKALFEAAVFKGLRFSFAPSSKEYSTAILD